MSSELVERLRNRAESYRMGGPSSEHTAALLDEAAARLEALEADKARLREALEPFARYASENGFGLDNNGAPLPDTDGVGWIYLTNGDFRAARRAREGGNADAR